MEKITSFTIDHLKLVPGLYVSRKDFAGKQVITTFDIRMTNPNEEPVMNTAEVHTIEHLGATFLRNHRDYASKITLLRTNGMPCYRLLSFFLYGDYESKRYRSTDERNVCFYRRLQWGRTGSCCKRLRKLSGHEPSDGKLYGKKISDWGSGKYYRKTAGLSWISLTIWTWKWEPNIPSIDFLQMFLYVCSHSCFQSKLSMIHFRNFYQNLSSVVT